MKHIITAALISTSTLVTTPALAGDIDVTITNLTNGIYFTPLLVAVHGAGTHLFQTGKEASSNLQAMAEGGDTSGLIDEIEMAGGTYVQDPASGVLPPGGSTTANLYVKGKRNSRLSITAMLLPTNDGFVGLNAANIPNKHGRYTYYLNGYDAGTEANDEVINGGGAPGVPGIPADPGENNGKGASGAAEEDNNTTVHIHRGILGDNQPNGGKSDLDKGVHRWLNPVAQVVVTVR
jgi:hypothetical protein